MRTITWTATDEAGNVHTAQTTVQDAVSSDWRGWPHSSTQADDPVNSANALYMNGPRPADPNGAYPRVGPLNNGYSVIVEDPTGQASTRIRCIVAPGDAGWVPPPKTATHDTRDEYTIPTNTANDILANESWDTIFIRTAVSIPSTVTAPVPVQNAQRSGWIQYQQSQNNFAQWPDGIHANPTTGDFTASAVVTNTKALVILLSNLLEDYGPAVLAWFRGNNSGVNGQLLSLAYQAVSLGVGLPVLNVDGININWDTRYDTITEIKPGLYATSDGKPWIVPPGTVTAPRSAPWSTTNPVAPYGPTPGVPGGAGFRLYRWTPADPTYGDCWRCRTEGNPYAMSGEAPVLDTAGNVLNAATYNPWGGWIPGPTLKGNGATLVSGPDGASGTALHATTQPPFNIVTTNPVAATGYRPEGGQVSVNGELMTFDTANNSTHTLHITARGILGTSPADHAVGEQIVGLIDWRNLSVGPNQAGYKSNTNYGLTAPFAADLWPPRVSRSRAFVCGAPAPNYP